MLYLAMYDVTAFPIWASMTASILLTGSKSTSPHDALSIAVVDPPLPHLDPISPAVVSLYHFSIHLLAITLSAVCRITH